ncbi:1-deoxy-D-xylulose-5-phosphate synthase [Bordetella pertussis]|nr:1-deoxy-D-xylulose-5-phosphate synthase [Bordetella pertussis]
MVADMRFVKPLDRELVLERSAVLETLAEAGVTLPVLQLGLPDAFIDHGDQAALLAGLGLDAAGIERAIRARFGALLA